MIDALKKGDKVVTIGGIHGVISSVKDQTVIVKVNDDAKIEFTRSAIASVIVDKPAKEKEEEKTAEKPSFFSRFKKSDDSEMKTDSVKN